MSDRDIRTAYAVCGTMHVNTTFSSSSRRSAYYSYFKTCSYLSISRQAFCTRCCDTSNKWPGLKRPKC